MMEADKYPSGDVWGEPCCGLTRDRRKGFAQLDPKSSNGKERQVGFADARDECS